MLGPLPVCGAVVCLERVPCRSASRCFLHRSKPITESIRHQWSLRMLFIRYRITSYKIRIGHLAFASPEAAWPRCSTGQLVMAPPRTNTSYDLEMQQQLPRKGSGIVSACEMR